MRVRKSDNNGNTRARRYGTHGPDGTRQERPENKIDAGAHRFLCRGSGPGFRAFRIEWINDEIFIGEIEHRYLRRIQQFAAQQFTASTQRQQNANFVFCILKASRLSGPGDSAAGAASDAR